MRGLLWLAGPIIAGQAGNQLMSFVDTAMVGRLGPAALGGVGMGNGIYFTLTLMGLGCVMGMEPLVSQAIGAGEYGHARRILWQGLRVAVRVGLPLTAVVFGVSLLLEPLGVNAASAHECRAFLIGRLPNVIPFLAFAAVRAYLQAMGVTRPVVIAMIIANIANFVGDGLLIYGDGALHAVGLPGIGLPKLGVVGSGISSSFAAILSVLVLALAARAVDTPADPDRRRASPEITARIWRLGLPLGLQLLAEVSMIATMSILAGRMGKLPVAAHQIAITLASFTFTVTLGIGSATSVLVGRAVGRGDSEGARREGVLGLVASAGFMTIASGAFLVVPAALARIVATDAAVIAAAIPLLQIAAVFQISDGTQAVAAGALRGAGDTRAPLIANVIGHYAIGLPTAVLLGVVWHQGAPGLWWGLSAGLTAVAVALTLRFLVISRRPIARA